MNRLLIICIRKILYHEIFQYHFMDAEKTMFSSFFCIIPVVKSYPVWDMFWMCEPIMFSLLKRYLYIQYMRSTKVISEYFSRLLYIYTHMWTSTTITVNESEEGYDRKSLYLKWSKSVPQTESNIFSSSLFFLFLTDIYYLDTVISLW